MNEWSNSLRICYTVNCKCFVSFFEPQMHLCVRWNDFFQGHHPSTNPFQIVKSSGHVFRAICSAESFEAFLWCEFHWIFPFVFHIERNRANKRIKTRKVIKWFQLHICSFGQINIFRENSTEDYTHTHAHTHGEDVFPWFFISIAKLNKNCQRTIGIIMKHKTM